MLFRSGKEIVLLAEDDELVRKFSCAALEAAGYEVLACCDGEQALEECSRRVGPIHLLFTDVVMPKMNGRELAERLKELRPKTKVLFASGYNNDKMLQEGFRSGASNFLVKPYSATQLLKKVREVLQP